MAGEHGDDDELEGEDAPDALAGEPEASAGERGSRRGPLSDEIAARWAPERLTGMVSSRAGRGQALDATTRARYERKLGVDLGDVRVYQGEFAQDVTRAHGAEAVTIGGTGMVLMGGTADRSPATAAGEALLAHELTHVAQGKRGVHARQAAGERTLATEEHELEAGQVEQEVEQERLGNPTAAPDQREAIAAIERGLKDAVLARLEADEAAWGGRQGPGGSGGRRR
jgi:hypothetical protein